MDILKESEWLSINRVLLELYALENEKEFQEKTLKVFRMLIPYTKGYFVVFDENYNIDQDHSAFLGMSLEVFENYMLHYYDKDYLKFTFEIATETMTYRDTDILSDSMRKKTDFFRNYLRPNNIPYGSGILLAKNSRLFGVINLFRSGELGDFSDKDMYIFDLLKDHMTNITYRFINQTQTQAQDRKQKLTHLSAQLGLTAKEQEVSKLILQGMTNAEISKELVISESTVKKHLYNLYAKAGVKNRLQLITLFDQ